MNNADRLGQLLLMLESEPADVFLNYALALEYLKKKEDHGLAEAQLRHVLSLDEKYVPAYYQLGHLMESQNNTAEALVAYRKGLQEAQAKKDRKSAGEFEEAIFLLED